MNSHCVTFVSNKDLPFEVFRKRLSQFQRDIDMQRFGKRFYKRPPSERLFFFVVPEHFDCANPHFHGALTIPALELQTLGFEKVQEAYDEAWAHVVPGGSLLLRPMYDAEGWVRYCSKETGFDDERAILSTAHLH